MKRLWIYSGLVLALFAGLTPEAMAQYVTVYRAPVVVAPPPVYYSYYPPVYQPVISTATYYPAVSYYQPITTTVYSAPVVAAPAVVATPGTVYSRSYYGYGIFRPRGLYTDYYFSPGVVTSYYPPAIIFP